MSILLIGNSEPTHVGRHFLKATVELGICTEMLDLNEAFRAPKLVRSMYWHLLGRRPVRLRAFGAEVLAACHRLKPDLVMTTGIAPLSAAALIQLRQLGVKAANFLTDDPWNPAHHAPWFMEALPHYDYVFSPRRANMADLTALNGPQICYLPFAYAPDVHYPPSPMSEIERSHWSSELLFIGGADDVRASIIRTFVSQGITPSLWGGDWQRYPDLRPFFHGHADPETFRKLVPHATINLCLVRRANRDGHSMRTFELAAVGGCLLVEETDEHLEIFGPDGECVMYAASDNFDQSVSRLQQLSLDTRARLMHSVQQRIISRGNTYSHRLKSLMDTCGHLTN